MADCDICKILDHKDAFRIIYEDDKSIAILHESPAAAGHTLVLPKKHFPIFEDVPEDMVGHLFKIVNVISTATFDSLGAHGTNILINNGTAANQEHAHFMIHVIPRKENDNLNFEWLPKKVSDEKLRSILSMQQETADAVFYGKSGTGPSEKKNKGMRVAEESYLVKQLHRIP